MNATDAVATAATLPFRIVESMGVPCGYERSFKFVHGSLLANRYLLGVDTHRVQGSALVGACRRMGMPPGQLDAFVEALPRANLVFLGFEADASGGAIYKVYLEFWDHVRQRQRAEPGAREPRLSHRGFKWRHDEPTHHVVTDYHWIPDLATADILARIARLYDGMPGAIGAHCVRDIVERAQHESARDGYIYIEVSEAGNPRRSFDLNLYPAGLTVGDIRRPIQAFAKTLDAPPARFERLMAIVADKLFGHVSGGVGRDGHEYLTVYYEN